MARVDFYVLEDADTQSRLRLACRLTEKAWSQTQSVFVLAAGEDEARALDDLLWTFRDRSFVPHEITTRERRGDAPVLIGSDVALAREVDVLVNLAPSVPDAPERFPRIVEPLDGDGERRRQGRERFRVYRERGFTLESHNVTSGNEL